MGGKKGTNPQRRDEGAYHGEKKETPHEWKINLPRNRGKKEFLQERKKKKSTSASMQGRRHPRGETKISRRGKGGM